MPLQAGHISSTASDFSNKLRGVTLNNKVNLNLVLIGFARN